VDAGRAGSIGDELLTPIDDRQREQDDVSGDCRSCSKRRERVYLGASLRLTVEALVGGSENVRGDQNLPSSADGP